MTRGLRKVVLDAVNRLLAPVGARLVGSGHAARDATFEMDSAIRRIATHGIPIRTIVDIGASDGKWSVAALRVFPDAHVLAIEPLSERRGALSGMKLREKRFDFAPYAAGESDGVQTLLAVTDDLDGSTIGGARGSPRDVPVRTIDSLVSERHLEGPFLLKFDTHGYEVPILNGARKTLADTNVIVMECYNFKISQHALRFPEMCLELERLGFRCYDVATPMLRSHDRAFWQIDLFFARSESTIFSTSEYR